MDELEDMLMEHGIMKQVDEIVVGKTAAELAAEAVGLTAIIEPSGPSQRGAGAATDTQLGTRIAR